MASEPGRTVKCLVLAGCTATGKSAMAMRIAERRAAEIISADSVAVYRGLNLGSAKPSALCRRRVQHHLIDVADPAASLLRPYTAGQFASDARAAIRAVAGRGHVPIVCGGSGMYLSFLIHGHDRSQRARSGPSSTSAVSETVDWALSSTPSWDAALARVAARLGLDPAALRRVQAGNRRRLIGAVERLRRRDGGDGVSQADPIGPPGDIDFRTFVLARPRLNLYRAIDLRCERMVQHGLLDEVAGLHAAGRLPPGSPPALAVGYRQALAYLDALRGSGQFDLGQFRRFLDAFQTASRQLARRQLTWFRQDPGWRWVDAESSATDDWVLGQLDLDRPAWDGHAGSGRGLGQLSAQDLYHQRRYVPECVIFKPGLDPDVILRLMADDFGAAAAGAAC